jgi:hypothetical protein
VGVDEERVAALSLQARRDAEAAVTRADDEDVDLCANERS